MSIELILLIVMLVSFTFLLVKAKLPAGISLLITAVIMAIIGGQGIPLRHLVEGMFGYIDVALVLITAMIFMKMIEQNGLLDRMTHDLMVNFGKSPLMMLTVATLIIMFPSAITGSCTASVLSTGALIAPLLFKMGMPKATVGAIIASASVYGMIAPPVNIPVMIIGGGIDMPYVGFDFILLVITLPLAILTSIYLGYKHVKHTDMSKIIEEIKAMPTQQGSAIYLPLLITAVLMIAPKAFPGIFPDPRLPLTFVIGSIASVFVGAKINVAKAAREGTIEIIGVVGILLAIGTLIQIMTLTGLRGYIAVNSLSLPANLLLLSIAITMPLFGGISVFGSASILGVPFILAFLSQNLIVVASAMSLIAAMGSYMPPVALTAVIAAQVIGEQDYMKIVRPLILPSIVAVIVGILLIKYSTQVAKFIL